MNVKFLTIFLQLTLFAIVSNAYANTIEPECNSQSHAFPTDIGQVDNLASVRGSVTDECLNRRGLDAQCSCLNDAQLGPQSQEFVQHRASLYQQLRKANTTARLTEFRMILEREFPGYFTPPESCRKIAFPDELGNSCNEAIVQQDQTPAGLEFAATLFRRDNELAKMLEDYDISARDTNLQSAEFDDAYLLFANTYEARLIHMIDQVAETNADFDYDLMRISDQQESERNFQSHALRVIEGGAFTPSRESDVQNVIIQYNQIASLFRSGVINEHFHNHMEEPIISIIRQNQGREPQEILGLLRETINRELNTFLNRVQSAVVDTTKDDDFSRALRRSLGFFEHQCNSLVEEIERVCSAPVEDNGEGIPVSAIFSSSHLLRPPMASTILQCQAVDGLINSDRRFSGYSRDHLAEGLTNLDTLREGQYTRRDLREIFRLRRGDQFLSVDQIFDRQARLPEDSRFSMALARRMRSVPGIDHDAAAALDIIAQGPQTVRPDSDDPTGDLGTSQGYDDLADVTLRTSHGPQLISAPTEEELYRRIDQVARTTTAEDRSMLTNNLMRPPRDVYNPSNVAVNNSSRPVIHELSGGVQQYALTGPSGSSAPQINAELGTQYDSSSFAIDSHLQGSFQGRQIQPVGMIGGANLHPSSPERDDQELDRIRAAYDRSIIEYEARIQARQQELENARNRLNHDQEANLQNMISSLEQELKELRASRDQLARESHTRNLPPAAVRPVNTASTRGVSSGRPAGFGQTGAPIVAPASRAVDRAPASLQPPTASLGGGSPGTPAPALNTGARTTGAAASDGGRGLVLTEGPSSASSNMRLSAQEFQNLSQDQLRSLVSNENSYVEVMRTIVAESGEVQEVIEVYEAVLEGDEIALRLISSDPIEDERSGRSIASIGQFQEENVTILEARGRLARHRELLDHLDNEIGRLLGL